MTEAEAPNSRFLGGPLDGAYITVPHFSTTWNVPADIENDCGPLNHLYRLTSRVDDQNPSGKSLRVYEYAGVSPPPVTSEVTTSR